MSARNSHDDLFDQRWLRSAIDLAICFLMAVIILRAFILEGYLISTGSMAPGLLGFHRRIDCPSCQYSFAFGVSFDDSVDRGPGIIHEPEGSRRYATCPNCGQINIDVSGVPNSHGDQLLVQKHFYDLRPPRRWETVVFNNPASPGEAYVKRVVGLPGERIRILNGDIYINGQIARKSFEQQQWMKIPVCNLHFLADAENWQLPWELDEGWQADNGTLKLEAGTAEAAAVMHEKSPEPSDAVAAITSPGNGKAGTSEAASGDSVPGNAATGNLVASERRPHPLQWIRFRNWRWFGGHHVAETPLSVADGLADWQSFLNRFDSMPVTWITRVDYEKDREVLRCEGVMPEDLQSDLLRQATTEGFRSAVYRLAALSHLAPVTDRYGYNAMVASPEYVVSDLMFRTLLSWTRPPDQVRVQIPVEASTFLLMLDPEQKKVQLFSMDDRQLIREGHYESASSTGSSGEQLELEVSNMDRQIIVAVNGVPCFDSYLITSALSPDETLEASVSNGTGTKMDAAKAAQIAIRMEQQNRWALGVSGDGVRIHDLEMYRDVFYTPGRRRNAVESEFTVPEGAYFVQGDNSPVSSDSRNWANPCVPHRLLIGKPFLVHLPSRPAVLQFGGQQWPIRIPEWSRIRYIR